MLNIDSNKETFFIFTFKYKIITVERDIQKPNGRKLILDFYFNMQESIPFAKFLLMAFFSHRDMFEKDYKRQASV